MTTTDCYRRTRQFIQTVLPKMGISATVIDPADMDGLEQALKSQRVSLFFSGEGFLMTSMQASLGASWSCGNFFFSIVMFFMQRIHPSPSLLLLGLLRGRLLCAAD